MIPFFDKKVMNVYADPHTHTHAHLQAPVSELEGEIKEQVSSVYLDCRVDFTHKCTSPNEAEGATQHSEGKAEEGHVTKIKDSLEQAVHLCFKEIVVEGVQVDIARCGRPRQETCPLPSVVLGVQQKVGAHNGHAHGHNGQDQEDQQHEAVHVVDLVRPEGGEDEVHFDEDGAKGQDAPEHDDDRGLHEPLLLGDGPGHSVDAAGVVGLARQVAAQHGTHQRQGQDDEQADACHRHHGSERDGPRRMVVYSDEVDDERSPAHQGWQHEGAHEHLFDPLFPSHTAIQTAPKVAIDG